MGEPQYITQEQLDKRLEKTDGKIEKTDGKIDLIYRGLFIDNGKPCHQTRLDRHDRMLNLVAWISGVLCVAVAIQVVSFLFSKVLGG